MNENTLQESAEKHVAEIDAGYNILVIDEMERCFIAGAKWQAELSIQDIKNIAFHENVEEGILSIHIADLHKLFKP